MIRPEDATMVSVIFYVISFLLFGFIAWKPSVWASITPYKPRSQEEIAKYYRWLAIAVLLGTTIRLLLGYIFHWQRR
jgi:hypothetical protein